MAFAAPRLPQVEHRVFVLPPLVVERHLGQVTRRATRSGAKCSWQKRAAHSGYRGQPEREGDLKRGLSCLLQRGYDGAKRLSGRKRFIVCDTLGLWLEVVVLPASVPERAGAEEAFWRLAGQEVCAALEVVWADAGFEGQVWQERIEQKFGFSIEIVKRCDGMAGFEVLPKRWIVERSFGWMNYHRRLSKDYEGHTHLSRAWLLWAMTDKMLRTLHSAN